MPDHPNVSATPQAPPTVPPGDIEPGEVTQEPGALDAAVGDTAGTGTIIALGCIGGTLFLIVLGLIYVGITQIIG